MKQMALLPKISPVAGLQEDLQIVVAGLQEDLQIAVAGLQEDLQIVVVGLQADLQIAVADLRVVTDHLVEEYCKKLGYENLMTLEV